MLKTDLVELKTNLVGAVSYINNRLETAEGLEKCSLEYLLPLIEKAKGIAMLTEELK